MGWTLNEWQALSDDEQEWWLADDIFRQEQLSSIIEGGEKDWFAAMYRASLAIVNAL